jgi:hypothetical protein
LINEDDVADEEFIDGLVTDGAIAFDDDVTVFAQHHQLAELHFLPVVIR